eukprot:UN23721
MSIIINRTRELFSTFDSSMTGDISFEEFFTGLNNLGAEMSREQALSIFKEFDDDENGAIDRIEWLEFLKVEDLRFRPLFCSKKTDNSLPTLGDEEIAMLEKMMKRLSLIASKAAENNVRLMIDAEHTYFQPAIDHTTLNLMREYNRDKHIVFNTYQGYLTDSLFRLKLDMEKGRREGWKFACKLVRGAYMNLER